MSLKNPRVRPEFREIIPGLMSQSKLQSVIARSPKKRLSNNASLGAQRRRKKEPALLQWSSV